MSAPTQFRRPLEWEDWGEPDLAPDLVLDNLRWYCAELLARGDVVIAERGPARDRGGSLLRLAGGPFDGCRGEVPSPRFSVWVARLRTAGGDGYLTFASLKQPYGRVPGSRLVGAYVPGEDWRQGRLRWTDLRGKVRANRRAEGG